VRLLIAMALFASSTIPSQAAAQLMGAKKLTSGVTIKGASSVKSAADLYYVLGEVGATETYTLTIKGPARISLFTPDGHEMVAAAGSGKISLRAVLNFTDVFVLAVSRTDTRQSYTLTRRPTVPTFAEAMMASFAGYERSNDRTSTTRCWLEPGVKLRETTPNYVRTVTLAANRSTLIGSDVMPSGSEAFEQTFQLESFQYHMAVKTPDSPVREYSKPYPENGYAFHSRDRPVFKGYLCS
jgi:hypothetical protein